MIITNPDINDLMADIFIGINSAYTAQELAFFPGSIPNSTSEDRSGQELAIAAFGANWGTFNGTSLITLNSPKVAPITTAGTCTFFRFRATYQAATTVLLQGNVTENGQGGDIQFNYLAWPSGINIDINNYSIQLPVTTP